MEHEEFFIILMPLGTDVREAGEYKKEGDLEP